jgi:hypothetical protein
MAHMTRMSDSADRANRNGKRTGARETAFGYWFERIGGA